MASSGVAHGQDAEFITQGISPGLVYSFEPILGGAKADFNNEWFLIESTDVSPIVSGAIARSFMDEQVVDPGWLHQPATKDERMTIHVAARSAKGGGGLFPSYGASVKARQFWAFQVTDPADPSNTSRVQAVISGRLGLRGQITVFGSGSAKVEARLALRERTPGPYAIGTPLLSESIASYEINHPFELSVSGGVGATLGLPFVGAGVAISAGRDFTNDRIHLEDEMVDFSFPVTVRVGDYYELEVGFTGRAENRGIVTNVSAIVFANKEELGLLTQDADEGEKDDYFFSQSDPSHLLNAIQFFKLTLPNIPFGKAFKGKETWKFPKLGALFDGKIINMDNQFKMEPMGKIEDMLDAFNVLGVSPNLGENIAQSGTEGPEGSPEVPNDFRGGVWICNLSISIASH